MFDQSIARCQGKLSRSRTAAQGREPSGGDTIQQESEEEEQQENEPEEEDKEELEEEQEENLDAVGQAVVHASALDGLCHLRHQLNKQLINNIDNRKLCTT